MIIKHQEIIDKLSPQTLAISHQNILEDANPFDVPDIEQSTDESKKDLPEKSKETPEQIPDPYEQESLSPAMFEQGKLLERRQKTDRRQSFRRDMDFSLLSSAEHEVQRLKEQARHQGYEEGLNSAHEEIEKLKTVISEFTTAKESILEEATSEIVNMATAIAKQILKVQIETAPETVVEFVKKAIVAAGKRQKFIVVRLHPSDLPIVEKAFEEKSPVIESVDLTLLEDASVDPGSCIIETQAGQIDKRFSTQLEVLERLMQKEGLL